jgi:hypothetical protein
MIVPQRLKILIAVVAVGLGGWLTYAVIHAGDDIPPPPPQAQTQLEAGRAEGRRLKFKAWTLDYDAISTSPDGTVATLDGVHDGRFFKNGTPTMKMTAKHVVVNLTSNDFFASGTIDISDIGGTHHRHFLSDAATYAGTGEILTLPQFATIKSDGATLRVANATVNFRTGDVTLGRIVGVR